MVTKVRENNKTSILQIYIKAEPELLENMMVSKIFSWAVSEGQDRVYDQKLEQSAGQDGDYGSS